MSLTKALVCLLGLMVVAVFGLFGAAIWVHDHDLAGRLAGTGVLLLFACLPVGGAAALVDMHRVDYVPSQNRGPG